MRHPLARFLLVLAVAVVSLACSPSLTEEELITRAREALASGDVSAAEVDVKSVLQKGADNADARVLYARIFRRQRNPAAAIEQYERALTTDDSDAIRMAMAKSYIEAGRADAFLEDVKLAKYLALMEIPEFRAVIARAYLTTGEHKLAHDMLLRVEEEGNDFIDVTRAVVLQGIEGDVEWAGELLQKVTERSPDNADAWSYRGALANRGADWEKAEEYYREAVNLNPFRLSDRIQLVNTLLRQQKYDEAEAQLGPLEKLLPNHPDVAFMRGQLLFDDGDLENALDYLSRTLAVDENHRGALMLAANANLRQNNLETARRQFAQYNARHPEDAGAAQQLGALLLQLGEAEEAEQVARDALEVDAMNIRTMGLLAVALATQGQHAESARVYEQIAAQEPDSAAALVALGSQQLAAGDTSAGIEQLRAAVLLDPNNAAARERLIDGYRFLGDLDSAAGAALLYVEQSPESTRALIYLARVRLEQEDFDAAKALFERVLALEPGNIAANGGIAGLAINAGDMEGAKAAFQAALAANPGNLLTSVSLAALHEQLGEREESMALLTSAMQASPTSAEPRIALARMAFQDQDAEQAIALLTPVEDSAANDHRVQQILTTARLSAGDADAAAPSAERLIELRPNDLAALALIARVDFLRGRNEQALVHIEKALQIQPSNVTLRKMLIETLVRTGELERVAEEITILPEAVQNETAMLVVRGRLALTNNEADAARELFERAFAQQRNNINLALVTAVRWSQGEQEEVIAQYREWLLEYPDDVLTRNALASRELERGNNDAAREQYAILVEKQPQNVAALNNLAWLLRETDSDKALEYIQRADSAAPQNASIKDTYAMVQMARGAYPEALALNQKALDANPDDMEVRYNRAKILNALGQEGEAISLLKLLVEGPVFPAQEDARKLLQELGGA